MIPLLAAGDPFPPVEAALREPDGLLAATRQLDPQRLEQAYRLGIFPWYSDGQPVLWWSPDPRMVLEPAAFHVTRSLRKRLRAAAQDESERIVVDEDFDAVMRACAAPRGVERGTWITGAVRRAYVALHRAGMAHSVEVRRDGELIAGLYGVSIGRMFFGESMFTRAPDRSKTALAVLVRIMLAEGVSMIDCQQATAHLSSLGAAPIPRRDFVRRLAIAASGPPIDWSRWCGRPLNSLLEAP